MSLGRIRVGVYSIAVIVLLSGWFLSFESVASLSASQANETIAISGSAQLDENAEYHPSNDSVQIVLSRNHKGPVRTKTVSFEEYAEWECLKLSNQKINSIIRAQFVQNSRISHGISTTAVHVYVPEDISISTVDQYLPNQIKATVRINDRTHTCTVPVKVERGGTFEAG